ncbi:MAG: hypothetical protein ABS949_01660 [Solibacillus sp.]
MIRFLTLYHFEKMAVWFFLVPLGAGLFVAPSLLFSNDFTVFLYPLLIATVLVLSMFLEQTIAYQTMLRTMPLPTNKLVLAKFLFSILIVGYQLALFALLLSNRTMDTLLPLLMIAFTICMIATNIVLLYHFYTGQQKNTTTFAIIFYLPLLFGLQQIESLFFTMITSINSIVLMLLIIVLTLANKQLCLYFAKTKNHY